MDNNLHFIPNPTLNEADIPCNAGATSSPDTALRLHTSSLPNLYFSHSYGSKKKSCANDGASICLPDGSSLGLGLGPSSNPLEKAIQSLSSVEQLNFGLSLGVEEKIPNPENVSNPKSLGIKRARVDLELCLSTGTSESDVTSVTAGSSITPSSASFQNTAEMSSMATTVRLVDEGSTSSCLRFRPVVRPKLNFSPLSSPMLNGHARRPATSFKMCQVKGCGKGARGASGRCISHGGGSRCQKTGCQKGAEGRTVFCKAHGGGRRCEHLGCTKSAEGRTDYCIAHGGGKRCGHEGCTRAARGKSGLCIRHGGGKRCTVENCSRSAEGISGLCISHGGGRRCQHPMCTKGAQGSTFFCKAHGGGKRCTAMGCTKGAEGNTPFCKGHGGGKRCTFQGGGVCPRSVHGGTLFCVSHGGGKRCAAPECTKSARGRTAYCVRHGGGKRCKYEGCLKSAQGSTDFCKAHGGGNRCSWGQLGSEFNSHAAGICDKFARGKTGLCAAHSARIQDKQAHVTRDPKPSLAKKMKEPVDVETDFDLREHGHQQKSMSISPLHNLVGETGVPAQFSLPEGRVHGGGLMAMLKRNSAILGSGSDGSRKSDGIPSS